MNERGFTLIELLLTVGILALIAGFSLPLQVSFQTRNELDTTTSLAVDMLRRAQQYARSGNEDSQWGFTAQSGTLTLFKGTTYATRDATEDETIAVPGSISTGNAVETSFSKLRGVPSQTGSLTLTSNNGDTRTITLNAAGMVNY